MAFNTIDQGALLRALSPVTRNMWREYRAHLPWKVCSRGETLAVFNHKRDAIDFARRVSAEGTHTRITQ